MKCRVMGLCDMAWNSLCNWFSTCTPSLHSPISQLSPNRAFTFSWTWKPAVILIADLYICSSLPSLPATFLYVLCGSAPISVPSSEIPFHIALTQIQPVIQFGNYLPAPLKQHFLTWPIRLAWQAHSWDLALTYWSSVSESEAIDLHV